MSFKSSLTRIGCWTGTVLSVLLLASSLVTGAGTPDVGLVTDLAGEVTYSNPGEKQVPAKAQAFLKVREGDRFKIPAGGMVQLTYFVGGRQETWRGPGTVEVGDQASREAGKEPAPATPEVKVLPAKVSKSMAGVAVAVSQAAAKEGGGGPGVGGELRSSGVIQTMGVKKPAPAPAAGARPLCDRDRKEAAAAEKTYQDLKKQAGPDDLTPEIYLLGVYANYGQYDKMAQVIDLMLAQRPKDAQLRKLKAWARAQASGKE